MAVASGGKGILISGFLKYPSTRDTILTLSPVPLTRASLIAEAASSSLKPDEVVVLRAFETFLRNWALLHEGTTNISTRTNRIDNFDFIILFFCSKVKLYARSSVKIQLL